MIILTNSIAQTIAPGQSATFDNVVLKTGRAECHRNNSGSINLCCSDAMYDIICTANIGSTEAGGVAQMAIVYDASPLLETTMISTTTAAGDLNNVGCNTSVKKCCCNFGTVTLVNTGETSINIGANPCLKVRRVA